MKNSIIALLLTFVCFEGIGQEQHSCCTIDATEVFARNAQDRKFTMSHDEPLPFAYRSERGKDISYKASDGNDAHGWEVKPDKPSDIYLFVIHEWWGLNDYIKKEAEKLSNDLGINVIALDLYDRKVAATREEASQLVQGVKSDRASAIIKGAYQYIGNNAKVFTIGWCFGGAWSLQSGLLGGKQVKGVIMYYGQPEKDVERLKTLHSDVLGIFGNKDQWPSPAMVDEFAQNMRKAEKRLILHRYEATHAFANPSNPNFDKAATDDAYTHVLSFIRERMK